MQNRRLILKVVVNDFEAQLVASAAARGGESVSGYLRRIALARSRQLVRDIQREQRSQDSAASAA